MTKPMVAISLSLLVIGAFAGSLWVGAVSLPVFDAIGDIAAGRDTGAAIIVSTIRLPRALLGVLVGVSLGTAGAALQGWLRNPLAEPAMIGISPCAALGAVTVFYGGWAQLSPVALPLGGMAGAAVAVVFLYALSGRGAGALTTILAGLALSSLAAALTSLVLSLSPNPYAIAEIVFWLLGSLADRDPSQVELAVPFVVAGLWLLLSSGPALDALTLGETAAASLGVDLAKVKWRIIVGTAMAVGASVAVAGSVGFVGLIVPHLLRPLVGSEPRRLMVPSALAGAALTLGADIAVRFGGSGGELKLGVATALIGAPFFLALVLRSRDGAR